MLKLGEIYVASDTYQAFFWDNDKWLEIGDGDLSKTNKEVYEEKNVKMKCYSCGGSLDHISGYRYKCPYCDTEYNNIV